MTTEDKDPIVTVPMGRGAWQGPASEAPITVVREVLADNTADTARQLTNMLLALGGPDAIDALSLARYRIAERVQELINEAMEGGDA